MCVFKTDACKLHVGLQSKQAQTSGHSPVLCFWLNEWNCPWNWSQSRLTSDRFSSMTASLTERSLIGALPTWQLLSQNNSLTTVTSNYSWVLSNFWNQWTLSHWLTFLPNNIFLSLVNFDNLYMFHGYEKLQGCVVLVSLVISGLAWLMTTFSLHLGVQKISFLCSVLCHASEALFTHNILLGATVFIWVAVSLLVWKKFLSSNLVLCCI